VSIRVVTDSTSDIPLGLADERGIIVVPLNVHFGDETYKDGIDITAEEFYVRLKGAAELPKTSQPSVNDFLQVYEHLTSQGDDVISIHISEKFSGTLNSALQARQTWEESTAPNQRPKGRVEIVDSGLASMGLGLVVMEVARLVGEGADMEQVGSALERMVPKVNCYVLLETLEYLAKGGRIGKANAFLGTLLNIKPILTITDGEVHPVERVRTRGKGIAKLIETAQGLAPIRRAAIAHSSAPEEVEQVKKGLGSLVSPEDVTIAGFGPVVGTYAGPGGLAICTLSEY
jgi:DegV family protein with EDD domain